MDCPIWGVQGQYTLSRKVGVPSRYIKLFSRPVSLTCWSIREAQHGGSCLRTSSHVIGIKGGEFPSVMGLGLGAIVSLLFEAVTTFLAGTISSESGAAAVSFLLEAVEVLVPGNGSFFLVISSGT